MVVTSHCDSCTQGFKNVKTVSTNETKRMRKTARWVFFYMSCDFVGECLTLLIVWNWICRFWGYRCLVRDQLSCTHPLSWLHQCCSEWLAADTSLDTSVSCCSDEDCELKALNPSVCKAVCLCIFFNIYLFLFMAYWLKQSTALISLFLVYGLISPCIQRAPVVFYTCVREAALLSQ